MYTPDDTRKMVFSLREMFHVHTQKLAPLSASKGPMPGQIKRITASPLSAVIKKNSDGFYHINTLGMTMSRWREIRYVGTRIQFVPLATTGKVDPEDITQSATGIPRKPSGSTDDTLDYSPQGSVHPYDAVNFFSYRGWLGGNFNVAKWDANKTYTGTDDEKTKAYINDCLQYDQSWLADDRFKHVKLTDGCMWDSAPLITSLEMAALGANTLFGFSNESYLSGSHLWNDVDVDVNGNIPAERPVGSTGTWHNLLDQKFLDKYFQPQGLILPSAGNEIHSQRWLPNPLAGLQYQPASTYTPGDEDFKVTGYWPEFPWFADRATLADIATKSDEPLGQISSKNVYARLHSYSVNYLVELCIEKFLNPVGIIRFPAAYGTMFFWNCFMEHIFELRKPFLTNSAWQAGIVEDMGHVPTALNKLAGVNEAPKELQAINRVEMFQSISPDPYGCTESPMVLTLADLAPHMIPHQEPDYRYRGEQPNASEVDDEPAEDA